MKRLPLWLLSGCLIGCTSAPLPPDADIQDTKLIAYHNRQGERILPLARSVPEERRKQWQNWLAQHRSVWQSGYGQTVSGATHWCVQWQQSGQTERLCQRGGDTLIWLGRGFSRDPAALASANRLWQPQP